MSTFTHPKDALYKAVAYLLAQPIRQKLLATITIGTITSSLIWCVRDYREFRALGKGGLPSNVLGWVILTFIIRPVALAKSKGTFTGDYPSHGAHKDVEALPQRGGSRALAQGIVPQRQMSQNSPVEMKQKIENLIHTAVKKHPDVLYIKKSLYEKHNDALFVAQSLLSDPQSGLAPTARISRGEICHIHQDLSVHIYLAPADAKIALDRKWGVRHLLARPKPLFGKYLFRIAPTYILLYGARDDAELEVLRVLIENSIRFMTGQSKLNLPAE